MELRKHHFPLEMLSRRLLPRPKPHTTFVITVFNAITKKGSGLSFHKVQFLAQQIFIEHLYPTLKELSLVGKTEK